MIAINQTMWTQDMHDDCCRGGEMPVVMHSTLNLQRCGIV